MESVYRYGLFNIAGASATDSQERLFRPRDPMPFSPNFACTSWRGKKVEMVWYDDTDRKRILEVDDSSDESLFKRGWGLQKRFLSRRNVIFTKSQIHYRCAEEVSCESIPPDHPSTQIPRLAASRDKERARFSRMKSLAHENCVQAGRILGIPAVHRAPEEKQIPGRALGPHVLQRHGVVVGRPEAAPAAIRRADVVVGPGATFAERGSSPEQPAAPGPSQGFATFLGAHTEPCGADEFGEIEYGWVRIKARVVCLGQNTPLSPSDLLQSAIKPYMMKTAANVSLDHNPWYDAGGTSMYYLLALSARSCWNDSRSLESRQVIATILAAVTPAIGLFQRVGLCELWCLDEGRRDLGGFNPVNAWLNGFKKAVERLDGEEIPSHERCADGEHIITII
ncbi:hypothetical protein JX265_011279 [Neoarthrinium moseri]|uniref:Uncharacterized protein n=1 Tax=Neoarthrinium moseri TaxID=1658444 RepID=A0A9P9WCS9_9PEZI|nr:hypothetical protein JX265_011279 [Neoarthrinium moseri]